MAQPRHGSGWLPGPRGRNVSLVVLSPQSVKLQKCWQSLHEAKRAGGLGREQSCNSSGLRSPITLRLRQREGWRQGEQHQWQLGPSGVRPNASFLRPQPGLQCKPSSASCPLQEPPRAGTFGRKMGESHPLSHPRAIPTLLWTAGREGVTWLRSVEGKMGRLPGPQAPSPRPSSCLLPCQGKTARTEQATTGLTYVGQKHAKAGQSSIFQINGSARSYQNPPVCKTGKPSLPFPTLAPDSRSSSSSPDRDDRSAPRCRGG